MTRNRALVVGIAGLIGCAVGLAFVPRDALIAWLVCWLAWGSIPIGALAVLMLVALIPGTWRALYAEPLTIGASLMPLVLIGVVPLLIGIDLIYPWTRPEVASTLSGFKGLWLSSSFFIIRNLVFILILSGLSWALIAAAPRSRAAIAAVGVLAYGSIGSSPRSCCGDTCTRCSTSSFGRETFPTKRVGISSAAMGFGGRSHGRCSGFRGSSLSRLCSRPRSGTAAGRWSALPA
jgi:hypothetical protein